MGFLRHIIRAISGDTTLAQDIKTYGEHIDIVISYIISILGVIGVFILTKFILFQNLYQNISGSIQRFDTTTQNLLLAILPTNFSEYLFNDIWQIIVIILGVTIIWLIGTGIIHIFSIIPHGRARFIDILVFTSLLLPMLLPFSLIFFILALVVVLKTGLLITLAIILAIALIIIMINALIKGISAIYTYSISNSVMAVLLTILLLGIITIMIGKMMFPFSII